jgi:hypothetical protein
MTDLPHTAAVLKEHWIYPREQYPGQENLMLGFDHMNVRKMSP